MEHMISNEMIIYFNMFCTSMKIEMSDKMGGVKIVTREDWGSEEKNV